jgi:hypothetical protein
LDIFSVDYFIEGYKLIDFANRCAARKIRRPDPRSGAGAGMVPYDEISLDFQHHFFRFCCFIYMNWKRSNLCDNLRLLWFLSHYSRSNPRLCGVIPHQRVELKPARYA